MKLRYFLSIRTAAVLALVMGSLLFSTCVWADSTISVVSQSGKHVTLSNVQATLESDGLHIEGTFQSGHFTPRRPLKGQVQVTVHDSDGIVVLDEIVNPTPLFVPKGNRKVAFSSILGGAIPSDATVSVTALN